jgi:hypothetical protein
VWIPGSYLVREFCQTPAKPAGCRQGKTHAAHSRWTRPAGWWTAHPVSPWSCATRSTPLTTRYAPPGWMQHAGFFNGTSLCLQVDGQQDQPHALELVASESHSAVVSRDGGYSPKSQQAGFWHLRLRLTTTPGGLPVRNGPVLERQLHRLRHSRTALWWPARHPALTAPSCWPTPRPFAKPRFASGMAKIIKNNSTTRKRDGGQGPIPFKELRLHAERRGRWLWRPGAQATPPR